MYRHTLTFTRNCKHPGAKHVVRATFESRTLQELMNNLARTVNRPCMGSLPPLAWESQGVAHREKIRRLKQIDRRENSYLKRIDLRVELARKKELAKALYDENGEWTDDQDSND